MSDASDDLTYTIDDVIITPQLRSRRARPPDFEVEAEALGILAQELATHPHGLLQRLAETVLSVCEADSAGVSMLEPGGDCGVFRWHAAAGAFASSVNGTVPREASPCGAVIARNQALLFERPGRHFPSLRAIAPAMHEALVVPWSVDGQPAGTLWAIGHRADRHFDAEDARLLSRLAHFAAAARHAAASGIDARHSEERFSAIEILRASEARFRLFVTASSDIVYRTSADWREVRALEGKHLLAATREPGVTWLDEYIPDSDAALVQATIAGAIRARVPFELEHHVVRADGTVGWVVSRAIPFLDERGAIIEWFGAATDITKRKQAEARQAFLLTFADAIRPLAGGEAVTQTACRLLAEHLNASRAEYTEVTGDAGEDIGAGMDWPAAISSPLVKNHRLAAVFSVYNATPRQWTSAEIELVGEVAERTWLAVERARAEEGLARSEDKYRTLFNTMDEGYALLELIYGADGRVTDFLHVEVNPAEEALTGLTGTSGKRMSELAPLEAYWLDLYGSVAATGKARRVEWYTEKLDRWFSVHASRVGQAGSRLIIAIFDNITQRKRYEANLAFLNDVSHHLERLTRLDEAMHGLGAALGAHFNASMCSFAEVDEDRQRITVAHEWTRGGAPCFKGVHRISDFHTDDFRRASRAGGAYVVRDTATDPRVDARHLAALSIGSVVCVPLVRSGQWRFTLSIASHLARDWRDDEIELLHELTTRVWTRLARGRAEEALRQAHAELEQRVLERTADLATANTSLQAENRERRAAEAHIKALFQRLVAVQEEERRRIARNIHDHLGQQMTALRMNLEAGRMRADAGLPRTAQEEHTERLAEELDRSIDFITWELRPAALDHIGLAAALRHLVDGWSERFGITAGYEAQNSESLRLPADAETNLYRIAQEALHNVVKHAEASLVAVYFEVRGDHAVVAVEDNGRGFAAVEALQRPSAGGLGLVSMHERAMLAGGTVQIDSAPGHGTTVLVRVPLANGSAAGHA